MKVALVLTLAFCVALGSPAAGKGVVAPKAYEGLEYLGAVVRQVGGGDGASVSVQGGQVGVQEITSIYYISLKKEIWGKANSECKLETGDEGYLVSIEDEEEDRAIHDLIRSSNKLGQTFWTAGESSNIGAWTWAGSTHAPIGYRTPARAISSYLAYYSPNAVNFNWVPKSNAEALEANYYICEISDLPLPCLASNDLVIVLDGSGSVSPADFELGKLFSARLAAAFSTPSKVSVIVYSSTSQVVIDINSGLSAEQIEATIKAAYRPAGNTATDLAIDDAIAQLRTNRGVPRKMVVLTDGASNNPPSTAAAAARANAAGIQTFSVGIGTGVNQQELLAIAGGNAANRFNTDSFNDLLALIKPVCARVCGA